MDKKILLLVVVAALVVLSLPLILSGLMTIPAFSYALGSADGWLSYWGGYLGAVIGLTAITIATQIQIKSQNSLHKEQLTTQHKIQSQQIEAQFELQKKQLDSQKELQLEAIKEEAGISLKREKVLIKTQITLKESQLLIKELLELNRNVVTLINNLMVINILKRKRGDLKKECEQKGVDVDDETLQYSQNEYKRVHTEIKDLRMEYIQVKNNLLRIMFNIKVKTIFLPKTESEIVLLDKEISEFLELIGVEYMSDIDEFEEFNERAIGGGHGEKTEGAKISRNYKKQIDKVILLVANESKIIFEELSDS